MKYLFYYGWDDYAPNDEPVSTLEEALNQMKEHVKHYLECIKELEDEISLINIEGGDILADEGCVTPSERSDAYWNAFDADQNIRDIQHNEFPAYIDAVKEDNGFVSPVEEKIVSYEYGKGWNFTVHSSFNEGEAPKDKEVSFETADAGIVNAMSANIKTIQRWIL